MLGLASNIKWIRNHLEKGSPCTPKPQVFNAVTSYMRVYCSPNPVNRRMYLRCFYFEVLKMEPELLEYIDDYMKQAASQEYFTQLYETWVYFNDSHEPDLFKAFVLGNLNGAVSFIRSSYYGRKITDLDKDELEELRNLLCRYYLGYKSTVKTYLENKQS